MVTKKIKSVVSWYVENASKAYSWFPNEIISKWR